MGKIQAQAQAQAQQSPSHPKAQITGSIEPSAGRIGMLDDSHPSYPIEHPIKTLPQASERTKKPGNTLPIQAVALALIRSVSD